MWVTENTADQYQCPRNAKPCCGKSCMAWRWGYFKKAEQPTDTDSFSAKEVGIPEGKFPPQTRFHPRRGYCGLAGMPS